MNKSIAIISVIFVAGIFFFWNSFAQKGASNDDEVVVNKVTIYKSPTCTCCGNYAEYMKEQGFQVEIITLQDVSSIKEKYRIPQTMESCHTMVIGDYFVEGHVPIEAVEKLLEEKPDIDGIALPEMPSGSPGMPCTQTEKFKIYALSNGMPSEFMTE